ncbi:unnamed protein product [Prunus armeniaca]|uniref:Uncharacterized protein n=1 Tax=Prunus armeniaca TaxID=36596 RepID=A0A6J5UUG2_PRUAR|nr:unnamed protein product [Prunus armeniaca]CAB4309992.1 unnamed protein product [Prunus armeniaca]
MPNHLADTTKLEPSKDPMPSCINNFSRHPAPQNWCFNSRHLPNPCSDLLKTPKTQRCRTTKGLDPSAQLNQSAQGTFKSLLAERQAPFGRKGRHPICPAPAQLAEGTNIY